jgi:hypothetical protein
MVDRSYRHCFESASAAAGRTLSDTELERIFTAAQARMNRYVRTGMAPRDAAVRAGGELAAEERIAAALRRREAARNVLIRQQLDARATPGREATVIREVLSGTVKGTRDAGNSVDAQRHAIPAQILGPMIRDLRDKGLLGAIRGRDKAFDRDVARELWRQRDPGAPKSGNKFAEATAAILHQAQETARAMQNEAGAWIGQADHYITRQNHDMLKVRGAGKDADYRAWRDAILPKLAPDTFDRLESPAEIEPFLRNVWNNIASGLHETSTDATLAPFSGPGNLAKRISQERVLHFKDADSWSDYNQQFGHGGVLDGVIHGIDKAGRDVALMRNLGTNPEALFKGWVDSLANKARDRGDVEIASKLASSVSDRGWNSSILDVVTGKADLPANHTMASIGATIRTMQQLSKLGGVVISSFNDLAVNASVLRHNGVPLLESYARQMVGMLPKGAGQREVADTLAVGIDGLLRNIMYRFKGEDGALGKMSRMVEVFHRANFMTWYSDSLHSAVGLTLTNNLGRNAGKTLAELPARLQTALRRYGIEGTEWDQLRAQAAKAPDGAMHILPSDVTDPALATKLQTYITDQLREGMHEPRAADRAMITWGTQKGTVAGELVRLMMQFKNYPLTFAARSLGREFSRDGVDVMGVAHLIVMSTALGYLSMTLKELAKGRNPRDPNDAQGYAKAVMAAMAQGGGLGIYGDFLFGEANRMGGGLVGSLAGPTAGTLEQAHSLFQAIRDGAFDKSGAHAEKDIFSQGVELAKNNAPLINLFYTRAALDHFIFYRLQEAANPGYLRRYEANVKRQNNQTFWLRPSEAVH